MNKRRGNGEGSIRQRANGSWQASVMTGYHPDGRRKIKYFTGKTKREAKEKMMAYLNDKESGLRVDERYTLQEWSEIFLKAHKPTIKATTYENYIYMIRIINHHLGQMLLTDIKPMVIDNFLQTLVEEGRSDSAISKCRACLHMELQMAAANDLIRRNPVQFCQKIRKRATTKQPCFTEEEMRILMQELPNNRIGHSIRLLLASGMRTQELLGLMPKHIAEDGSQIIIEQAVTMVRGTAVISTPKSNSGYRTIPIPESVRHCAIALRETDADYIWSVGDPHKPANPSTFRTAYQRAIEAVPGVTYRPPHSCRRAYVSILQAKHVDMATVQSLVGHHSLAMTQHYLTVHPSIQKEAITKFDEAFGASISEGE